MAMANSFDFKHCIAAAQAGKEHSEIEWHRFGSIVALNGVLSGAAWAPNPFAGTAWENNFATLLNARERQRTSVDDRA